MVKYLLTSLSNIFTFTCLEKKGIYILELELNVCYFSLFKSAVNVSLSCINQMKILSFSTVESEYSDKLLSRYKRKFIEAEE